MDDTPTCAGCGDEGFYWEFWKDAMCKSCAKKFINKHPGICFALAITDEEERKDLLEQLFNHFEFSAHQ